VQATLTAFIDAVVIVDTVQYQRRRDESENRPMPLRTLHFGRHQERLVTFLVYPPDDLVLAVKIQYRADKGSSLIDRSYCRESAGATPSR
jgi:hypothetical protein